MSAGAQEVLQALVDGFSLDLNPIHVKGRSNITVFLIKGVLYSKKILTELQYREFITENFVLTKKGYDFRKSRKKCFVPERVN